MQKNRNRNEIKWHRLTNGLLNGISKIRRMPLPDKSITLYDDLIEVGATEEEAKFLVRRAKRLGIETR